MSGQLEGKVAVVTGASGGLGEHFARLLAREGAAVAITARRTDRIEALADALNREGGRAIALPLDVTDAEAIGPALDRAQDALGPLDILVNNAGVGGEGKAVDLTVEAYDNTYAVNQRATFVGSREAARRMIAARTSGRIVNIASIHSHWAISGIAAYAATKAAVAMMTKVTAREWARHDIAVNALCPGYISTDINSEWFETEGGRKQINGWPRRRLMQPSDLDGAFLLLAGPGARAITGTCITVDDGQSVSGGG